MGEENKYDNSVKDVEKWTKAPTIFDNKDALMSEETLKGGFGSVRIGSTGEQRSITKALKHHDGSVTITLGKPSPPESNKTEDIDFEIIQPKQIGNLNNNKP